MSCTVYKRQGFIKKKCRKCREMKVFEVLQRKIIPLLVRAVFLLDAVHLFTVSSSFVDTWTKHKTQVYDS